MQLDSDLLIARQHAIKEFIDVEQLQLLMQKYSDATGLATALLELSGEVLIATNWQDACNTFHRQNPVTCANCQQSDTALAGQLQKGEQYNVYRCKNGLVDVATPVMIDGQHLGNLFTGQFFFEKPDLAEFEQKARNVGFEVPAYLQAISKVPVYSEKEIEAHFEFLVSLAELIGKMGADKKKLKQRSHDLLVATEQTAHIGHWQVNLEDKSVMWSDEVFNIYGVDKQHFRPELASFVQFFHPEDQHQVETHLFNAMKNGQSWQFKLRLVRPNGEIRKVVSNGQVQRTAAGVVERLFGTILDVTEQEFISGERDMLLKAVQETTSGIVVTDAKRQVIWSNPAFSSMSGYSFEEVKGRNLRQILQGDQTDQNTVSSIGKRLANHQEVDVEIINYHKNGQPYWNHLKISPVLNDGKLEYFVGVQHDITKRKDAEASLAVSEQKYESLVEAMQEGIVFQLADGSIQACNKSAERILGLTKAQMMGRTSMDPRWRSIHEDGSDFPGETHPMMHTLRTGEPTSDVIMGIHHPNGELRWISINCTPVFNHGERKPYGAVGSMVDITEQRKLESELRQTQKMEAIGRLAGGIAHDFNNQLASVMGFAELLESKLDDPLLINYVRKIAAAAERSGNLTGQLLTFSRKGDLKLAPVDVHQLLNEVAELLSRAVDKKINVVTRLESHEAMVMADQSLLQNALLNLGLNARDAMPDGGTMTLSTCFGEGQDNTECCEEAKNLQTPFIEIGFSDTGCGIAHDALSRIFEPFYTTKGPGEGTGLGLAAVYGSIEQMHGVISVDSEQGVGTKFSICLPLSVTKEAPMVPMTADILATQSQSKTILMVDDEPLIREMFAEYLDILGHKGVFAANGLEAVNRYRECWQDVDLVVLDAMMPKMNGKEAFEAMKAINPGIKAIVASGYTAENSTAELLAMGVLQVLGKPFKLAQLENCIEAFCQP